MNPFLAAAYMIAALFFLWHAASSPKRDAFHRAMLALFGIASMNAGAARYMMSFGEPETAWAWMVAASDLAVMAFAGGWLWHERNMGRGI